MNARYFKHRLWNNDDYFIYHENGKVFRHKKDGNTYPWTNIGVAWDSLETIVTVAAEDPRIIEIFFPDPTKEFILSPEDFYL